MKKKIGKCPNCDSTNLVQRMIGLAGQKITHWTSYGVPQYGEIVYWNMENDLPAFYCADCESEFNKPVIEEVE